MLQVGAVLHHIEAGNLLPPLVVLAILAKNPTLQLRVVKNYIARQLSAESAHIQEDRAQIAKYQQETAQMRAEVKELRTQVRFGLHSSLKKMLSDGHITMQTHSHTHTAGKELRLKSRVQAAKWVHQVQGKGTGQRSTASVENVGNGYTACWYYVCIDTVMFYYILVILYIILYTCYIM